MLTNSSQYGRPQIIIIDVATTNIMPFIVVNQRTSVAEGNI